MNKIRRNQERDQQNYEILLKNGWQVIVIWECQLKASVIEQTMRQVEVQLNDYLLSFMNHRTVAYSFPQEEDLPLAAEEWPEYQP